MAVILGLGSTLTPQIVKALEQTRRPSVIWLQLQECTGCVESVIRTAEPTIGDLVLDLISLDYNHTLMAAAGSAAESALHQAMEENSGQYVLLVTGSVPLNEDGIYTTIGGRTAKEVLEEAAEGAAAVIAIGACAHWGNIQASNPNPTGAVGVSQVVFDKPVVNIAGCPPIADVVTATLVHFLTFGRMPDLDYKMGCKGPASFSPCPIFQWNTRTNWPIGAGHPCIGCTERGFWDRYTPFYERLPEVAGFGVESTADTIGFALAAGATAGVAAHAVATGVHRARMRHRGEYSRVDVTPPGEEDELPNEEGDDGQN
jgi:hydrogenase small subunit